MGDTVHCAACPHSLGKKPSFPPSPYLNHPGPDLALVLAQGLFHLLLHLERGAGVYQGLGLPGLREMRGFAQPELLCADGPAPQRSRLPPVGEMWKVTSRGIQSLATITWQLPIILCHLTVFPASDGFLTLFIYVQEFAASPWHTLLS